MTKTFYLYRNDGMLLSTAYLTDEEAVGQSNITATAPTPELGKVPWFIVGEDRWENRDPVVIEAQPRELRARMYPPIGEQLDMLWHAMRRGEIPVARDWFETIKAVKDEAPVEDRPFEVGPMPEE